MKDEIHEDITVYEVDENYETIMIASSIETDTHVKIKIEGFFQNPIEEK
jgi:hypothetical protein